MEEQGIPLQCSGLQCRRSASLQPVDCLKNRMNVALLTSSQTWNLHLRSLAASLDACITLSRRS